MNLYHLRYFVTLAHLEHYTKAADDLWHKVNTQSSEKSHIDLSFSLSCKLETVYRGIQPVQGLFHILQKRLAIFGERNIPSVFFE